MIGGKNDAIFRTGPKNPLQTICVFVKITLQEGFHLAKHVVNRVDRNLSRRLREARREVGLSTRAVAERLPRKIAVSHATIASYENGLTVPPLNVLAALAEVYSRPLNWFLENRDTLVCFRYRNLKSRVPLSERRQFEALAGKWADAYFNLEKYAKVCQPCHTLILPVHEDLAPDVLATKVRTTFLNLDDCQPIQNMVLVLESFSARVLEIKASFGIDAAAARRGDAFVVVLNPSVANDRVRMNAAHELAHLLYDGCKAHHGWSDDDVEKRAYVFASSLLIPESQLKEAFGGKSFLKLIQYREKFGVSLAAIIYLAEKSRIINTTTSRWLWSEMARRGWRQKEPGYVWRDRAISFEIMLESAIQTKTMSWSDAERITGIREEDLRQRILSVLQSEEPTGDADHPITTLKFTSAIDTKQTDSEKK